VTVTQPTGPLAAGQSKPPRVVAELGRPETPDETAARKAENSRKHRSNQTLVNLLLALLASLAVMLFVVLVVVRPDGTPPKAIDYRAVASQSQPTVDAPLAVPKLPKGWSANAASVDKGADGITSWSVGFITPANQYIGFVQGLDADRTWTSNELKQARSTGTVSIAGTDWLSYNRRSVDDPGNYAYSLSSAAGASSLILHGSASTKEFRVLAAAITAALNKRTDG
jgi:hypothetical protein